MGGRKKNVGHRWGMKICIWNIYLKCTFGNWLGDSPHCSAHFSLLTASFCSIFWHLTSSFDVNFAYSLDSFETKTLTHPTCFNRNLTQFSFVLVRERNCISRVEQREELSRKPWWGNWRIPFGLHGVFQNIKCRCPSRPSVVEF